MPKIGKIFIIVLLVGMAGFFVVQKFLNKPSPEEELEAMKQSIMAPANVKASDLTEEQKNRYLQDLKKAQNIVVERDFNHLQSINEVGFIKKNLGDLEGAITAWEYANIIRPKNSLTFFNLANLYFYDLKQFDKAEKNYIIAWENEPGDMQIMRNLYELYYLGMKDNSKTEAFLVTAIQENPKLSDLTALLAGFYVDTGNIPKGIEYYEKHLQQNPKNDPAKKELERLKKELRQ